MAETTKRKETRAEFYARNAAKGRTVRFEMNLDATHMSDEESKRVGLSKLGVTLKRATLTPEQAKRVWDAVLGDGLDASRATKAQP